MVKEATSSLYRESQASEKAESKSISKENISYAIFERSNKKVVEDVTKNPQPLYLLYGSVGSGKTSILNYLFNIAKNKRPECVFLDGNLMNIPRRFFASIGGKIESHEDWRVSGRGLLRKFKNKGILFIDDFDKMLDDLGDDFAAFLRASVQEFKIGVVATATSESKEFKKTIIFKKINRRLDITKKFLESLYRQKQLLFRMQRQI